MMTEQPQPAAARALDVGELEPEVGVRMTFDPARCNHAVSCVVNYEVVTRTVHAIDCPHCLRHKIQQQADEIDQLRARVGELEARLGEGPPKPHDYQAMFAELRKLDGGVWDAPKDPDNLIRYWRGHDLTPEQVALAEEDERRMDEARERHENRASGTPAGPRS